MLNYVLLIGTIGLLLILIYAIFPALLTRVFKKFAIHQLDNSDNKQIALTFDDGPHPIYTPILLDLLQSKSIKATFFILGSEAEKNPAIIKRMHEEGHLIGIHNYKHICNWLLSPNALKNQIEKTANSIQKITKSEPKYYRPPWGLISLPTIFNKKYQTVLWSVMAYDWDNKNGSDEILNL
ncbi:polysaccharide deacetylase family protein [Gottfriedia luciferensis]|uniref:polysaccharide deacetylase family protein n=1 Tax=Gottfriedia luciferensis TaxID=178774 RepID=UPI000B447EAB|nr:polysaccharide deacetylase family protein [Gottfriedia luciferensis]